MEWGPVDSPSRHLLGQHEEEVLTVCDVHKEQWPLLHRPAKTRGFISVSLLVPPRFRTRNVD